MRWLVPGNIFAEIQARDPGAAAVLATPATWTIDDPGLARYPGAPYPTPVARYRSFARLQADVHAKLIDPAYRWVLYDPENWPDTPQAEQADPWTAMQDFGQYAHAHGYRVIMAPARDLGSVARNRKTGETLSAWYLRTEVAWSAARDGDVIDIQAQAVVGAIDDVAAYAAFVSYISHGDWDALLPQGTAIWAGKDTP